VHFGDVVDQFHDQNRFAHAGTTEETDFTTLGVRRQKVDDLDAGFKHNGFGRLLGEFRGRLVDRATLVCLDRALFVNRLADHVQDAAQSGAADGNRNRLAGICHGLTAHQTFGGVHRDGANSALTKVLRHFEDQLLAIVIGFQRVQDRWQVAVKVNVHHGADDLGHFAICFCHDYVAGFLKALPRPK
jgi:hypothetical protein